MSGKKLSANNKQQNVTTKYSHIKYITDGQGKMFSLNILLDIYPFNKHKFNKHKARLAFEMHWNKLARIKIYINKHTHT